MLEGARSAAESERLVSYEGGVSLERSVNLSLDEILQFRSSIARLAGVAPDMTEACEEAGIAVEGTMNELTLGKAYILRVKDLLQPTT